MWGPMLVRAAPNHTPFLKTCVVTCHKTVTPATIHSPCCVNSTTCSGLGQPRCQLSPDLLGFKRNSSPTHFTLNSTAWAAPALNCPANRRLLTSWPSLPFLNSPPFSPGVKPSQLHGLRPHWPRPASSRPCHLARGSLSSRGLLCCPVQLHPGLVSSQKLPHGSPCLHPTHCPVSVAPVTTETH